MAKKPGGGNTGGTLLKVSGTNADDLLIQDYLEDELIDGKRGYDTLDYSSNSVTSYSFSLSKSTWTIKENSGAEDLVSNVEQANFSDINILLTGENNIPLAVDDTEVFTENETETLLANVISNDWDFEGDQLSISGVTQITVDGKPDNTGGVGSAIISADGNSIIWTPGSDFEYLADGETVDVVITYVATDGVYSSASGTINDSNDLPNVGTLTITVTGTNDGPVANVDTGITDENDSITVDVLNNDTDVDLSDTHTVDNVSITTGLGSVLIVAKQVQWTPGTDYDYLAVDEEATVVIAYSMSDNNGGIASSTLTLTVTGSNDGPVANVDTISRIHENARVLVDALSNDNDVDLSDTHTIDSVHIITGFGAVDIIENRVEWTAGTNYDYLAVGEEETVVVGYTMSDNHGVSSSSTVTINIMGANDGPVANVDTATTDENASISVNVLGNDTDFDLSDTHTIDTANITTGNGTVLIVANQVQWTPGTAYDYLAVDETAEVVINYTMSDQYLATSTSTLTLTIIGSNDGPEIQAVNVTGAVTEAIDTGGSDTGTSLVIGFEDLESLETSTGWVAEYEGFTWTNVLFGETDEGGHLGSLNAGYRAVALETNSNNVGWIPNSNPATISRDGTFDFDGLVIASAHGDADPTGSALDYNDVTITGYLNGEYQGSVTIRVDKINPLTIDLNTVEGLDGSFNNIDTVQFVSTYADQVVIDKLQFSSISADPTSTNVNGYLTFTDFDLTDRPTATEAAKSVNAVGQDGLTSLALTAVQIAALEAAFSISADAANTNDGTINWTYAPSEADIDFLGEGEIVTAVFTVTVTDDEGASAQQDVTIIITGTNDTPTVEAVVVSGSLTEGDAPQSGDPALNNDDIFVTNYYGSANGGDLLLNDGAGNLTGTDVLLDPSRVRGMDAGDLNGDGLDDIVMGNDGYGASVYLNNGDGTFTKTQGADFNYDYSGRYNQVYVSNGWDTEIADFDGDGDLDAYIATWSNIDSLWLNDGSGTLGSETFVGGSTSRSRAVESGDLDGDGDIDVVVARSNNWSESSYAGLSNLVLLNNGDGTFTSGGIFGGDQSYDIDLADVDGDGDIDVFVSNYQHPDAVSPETNTLWLNNGSGQFSDSGQTFSGATKSEFGDLDGDGDVDLIIASSAFHDAEVWLNDGSGNYTNHQSIGTGAGDIALFDIDNDGDLDVFLANGGGADRVLINDGSANFTESNQGFVWDGGSVAAISGDFDGSKADEAAPGVHNVTGSIIFADVDATDLPTAQITANSIAAIESDGSTALTLTLEQVTALEAAFSISEDAANTNNGTINWDYSLGDQVVDFLGEGEVITAVFTITVTDDEGATAQQDVTLTVTGTNDGPIALSDTATTDENASISVNVLTNDTDVDLSDTHTVDSVSITTGLGSVLIVANQVQWTPGTAYDYLAVDETAVVVIAYDMSDNNGGLASSTLTLTVTGSNDEPTISAAITSGSTEDSQAYSLDLLSGVSDVDTNDTLNVSGLSVTGNAAGISLSADGNSLDIDPSAYHYLASGVSEVISYSYNIIDGNGGSVSQSATITMTGTNDAPTVSAAVTDTRTEEDAIYSIDLLEYASDVNGDTLSVANLVLVSGTGAGVTLNGNSLTVDPYAYDSLLSGESATIEYSYDVVDSKGGSVTQTAIITITGVTDGAAIIGTELNDSLFGTSGDDHIVGLGGDDFLVGGGGNDVLEGGSGNDWLHIANLGNTSDHLDGGSGIDKISLGDSQTSLDFNLSADADGSLTGTRGGGLLDLTSIEWLYSFAGGSGNDTIDVSGLSGQGEVTLSGSTGVDTLIAGDGNDTFVISDTGLGDHLDGGLGSDKLSLVGSLATQNYVLTSDVSGQLVASLGGVALDFSNIENVTQFWAGSGDDDLDVSGLVEQGSASLSGGYGFDRLIGGSSNDGLWLSDLSADDYLDGGDGVDWAVLQDRNTTLDIILSADANGKLVGSIGGESLDFNSIESLRTFISGSGNDSVDLSNLLGQDSRLYARGGSGDDIFIGSSKNDELYGEAGADILAGGTGNDTLIGGTGADTFVYRDGDTGTDTITDFNVSDGDIINLIGLLSNVANLTHDAAGLASVLNFSQVGTTTLLAIDTTGDGVADQSINLSNINLTASQTLTDQQIISNMLADGSLVTTDNDAPTVSAGVTDTRTEEDALYSIDLLEYASDVNGDTLSVANLVLVSGTGAGVTLNGNSLTVDPYAYDSLLSGESATIEYSYDVVDSKGGSVAQTATIKITGVTDGTAIVGTEFDDSFSVLNGTYGDDHIVGLAGNDVLTGRTGVDILEGGSGNDSLSIEDLSAEDHLDGGDGVDSLGILLAYNAYQDIILNANNNGELVGSVNGNVLNLTSIEGLSRFVGAAGHNTVDVSQLSGQGGVELHGRDGGNTFIGGTSRDTLTGGAGTDIFYGGEGGDRLNGLGGADNLYGGMGDDWLYGGEGNDVLNGDDGRDHLDGGEGDDVLNGGAGNDSLIGGAGTDILNGGEGDDFFTISTIADVSDQFIGGLGTDSLEIDILSTSTDRIELTTTAEFTLQGSLGGVSLNLSSIENVTSVSAGAADDSIDVSDLSGQGGSLTFYGQDGNDTFIGGTGRYFLYGGAGKDYLSGGDGSDVLYGGSGSRTADTLNAGDNTLNGGLGDDVLYGGDGNDDLKGDAGNDLIYGIAGTNTLDGGDGDDTLVGGSGVDTISGGQGNDRLNGWGGSDSLSGGSGNDQLSGGDGDDILNGGDGNDNLVGGTGMDIMDGGAGDDLFLISASYGVDDQIIGGLGIDLLEINNSTTSIDRIELNAAADLTLLGTMGGINLKLDSIEGVKLIRAGSADDNIDVSELSGQGDVEFYGRDGNDTFISGAGNDRLYGDNGDDFLSGGAGNDNLFGGYGTNTLSGGVGNDSLYGGNDTDTLNGGDGNDVLYGGGGNDILTGGLGDDYLVGQFGADSFVFINGDTGTDRIADFNAADGDVLDLTDLLSGISVSEDGASLDYYLNFSVSGLDAVLDVDVQGDGLAIILTGQAALVGASSDVDIINSLLATSNLDAV